MEKNKEKWCVHKVAFLLRKKLYGGKIQRISSIDELKNEFQNYYNNIDIVELYDNCLNEINGAIASDNYDTLLRYYYNKGIMTRFAHILHICDERPYSEVVIECLKNNNTLSKCIKERYFNIPQN